MSINKEKIFVFTFGALCTFGAICLSSYWIYKYWLDEEVSVVHYTKFHESSDNVFPTLSLCVTDPFVDNRLAEYGSNQTSYSASRFSTKGSVTHKDKVGKILSLDS